MTTVLLVEDADVVRHALMLTLGARGYEITGAPDGESALDQARRSMPDVVVLDLGLPDMDGLEVLTELRAMARVPIVVLSARRDQADKVRALDAGADDFVTKPFGVEELLARLRAAVRRATPEPDRPTIDTPDFSVDLRRKEVVDPAGNVIHLTPTEWSLLECLARRPGAVIESSQLLRDVWGPTYGTETNYLRVYMAQLRKKLEPNPARPTLLTSEPGIGYRMNSATDSTNRPLAAR